MSEETTNPVGGEAMPEVVDTLASESEALDLENTTPDTSDDTDQGEDEGDGLEDVEFDGKQHRLPKEIKDALLRQSDYTKKTQEVAEQRKAIEADRAQVQQSQQRQVEFAQDIAQLGALNARLHPFAAVTDWPAYLRQGGGSAQADYAEFQALKNERDQFAQDLGSRVQQRQGDEQRETAKLASEARAEIVKSIPGYSEDTLSKLVGVGERFGFSSDEIRQAESDPRSIRVLHRLAELEAAASKQITTQKLVEQQAIRPAAKVSGSAPAEKTPERMTTDEWMRYRNAQARKAR